MTAAGESKPGQPKRRAQRAQQSALGVFSLAGEAPRYAAAIFLGSTLLFLLEPIAAKRLLPLLGGSAAVWTACLVFFQIALLIGYCVAHGLVARATVRTQVYVYVALLGLSFLQLLRAVGPNLSAQVEQPVMSVLRLLTGLIGVPFVTLSATSPLLQAWFARSAVREEQGSAYRLFAISNVGSIVALLLYPWLIEPRLTLRGQTIAVAVGFGILAALAGTIAYSTYSADEREAPETPAEESAAIPISTRVLWIALATCGSLLLAAVTTHISQNVVAIPLVWIVPLVAYLLSFVIAFGTSKRLPRGLVANLGIAGVVLSGYLLYAGILNIPIVRAAALFCIALFVLCLFLHTELYDRRPPTAQLTSFYLYVAAGGALGAVLAGIFAPLLLTGNYEFAFGLLLTAALGLIVAWPSGRIMRGVWSLVGAGAVALIATQVRDDQIGSIARVRNFYGTARVTEVAEPLVGANVRSLYHGVITHGRQVFRTDLRGVPGTYYAPTSGLGLALDLCCGQRPRRVGVVGLGTGTIAAYGRAGDTLKFYEINRAIDSIALSKFTYLTDSRGVVQLITGDARVSLSLQEPQRYDVIVVDAFSGDAIPVHLITAQALDVYRRHLVPGGIIAFHVSNRYLNLPPVVEQLARNAGMQAVLVATPEDLTRDAWYSEWVLVTTNAAFLAQPAVARARQPIDALPGLRLWTDDYSSLLPVIRIKYRGF